MLLQMKDLLNNDGSEPQLERGDGSTCKVYLYTSGHFKEPDTSDLYEPPSKCIKTSDKSV